MAFTDRLANRGSISTGYDIDNSCRFDNVFNSGTAQAGASATITLASGADGNDNYYNGSH